jgi:hypothetical protein
MHIALWAVVLSLLLILVIKALKKVGVQSKSFVGLFPDMSWRTEDATKQLVGVFRLVRKSNENCKKKAWHLQNIWISLPQIK